MPRATNCRHCDARLRSFRVRDLCHACYADDEILAMYATLSLYRDWVKEPPLADSVTDCLPGSEGKIAVMAARVVMGRRPLHPGDKRA